MPVRRSMEGGDGRYAESESGWQAIAMPAALMI